MAIDQGSTIARRSFHAKVVAALLVAAVWQHRTAEAEPPRRPVPAFYELRADGSGFRKLFEVADYSPCHSPRISPDGKRIAFDGWKSQQGEGLTNAHVLICNLDGTELVEVCLGSMPSWSPDGKRIACSRYSGYQGVWIMDVDGGNDRRIDREGWGIQWSPVGDSVAYSRGKQVVIHHVAGGEEKTLFPAEGGPYRNFLWNMTWSGDGRRLAVFGDTERGRELAIIDAKGAELGFQKRLTGSFNPMLSWSPDGTRLVFPEKIDGRVELREIELSNSGPSRRVAGIPVTQKVASACWHPDGERLIVLGHAP